MSDNVTPAEQRAADLGLPIVAVTTFDLLHAASGHSMIVRTLDGSEVLLRLYSAEEFHAAHVAAVESMPTGIRPPVLDIEQAARLVQPLPEGAL